MASMAAMAAMASMAPLDTKWKGLVSLRCWDMTMTNIWMDADSEQELFTRSSCSDPAESLTQMHFIMSSRKSEMRRVQVLDSDWFKTDHRAVFAVLTLNTKTRFSAKSGASLRGWKPDDSSGRVAAETLTDFGNWNVMAPLLLETAKSHRKFEFREMSVTELELKSLLLRKKREGRQLGRTELNWLCRAIWRKRRALKREKHLNKIKESAEMAKAPKKTQSKHFNWSSLSVGAQKTHWTSHPKMVDKSIMVDGLAVLWEEVLEFVGSKVCLEGECKTCDRAQISSSQQVSGEVETCFDFFMASKIDARGHCKNYNVAGFSLEFECLDDDQDTKRQQIRAGAR